MCGICGVINSEDEMLKRFLLLINENRGKDSVGAYYDGNRVRIPEKVSDVMTNIPNAAWQSKVFLGHTRNASFNTVTDTKESTHPFKYGNILGAHNGKISNLKALENRYSTKKNKLDFDVDSEIIFWGLDKHGLNFLTELEGVAACWWVDLRDIRYVYLWAARKQLAILEADDRVVFSSDVKHLKAAGLSKCIDLKTNGQVLKIDTETNEVYRVEVKQIKKEERGFVTVTKSEIGLERACAVFLCEIEEGFPGIYDGEWGRPVYSTNAGCGSEWKVRRRLIGLLDAWNKKGKLYACPKCKSVYTEVDHPLGRRTFKQGTLVCPDCDERGREEKDRKVNAFAIMESIKDYENLKQKNQNDWDFGGNNDCIRY